MIEGASNCTQKLFCKMSLSHPTQNIVDFEAGLSMVTHRYKLTKDVKYIYTNITLVESLYFIKAVQQ